MTSPAPTRHRLDRTQGLHLRGPLTLTAESGTLWVTQDHEPDDHVLEPGAGHAVPRGVRALVGSLGGAAVVRVQPAPAGGSWRAGAAS